MHPHDDALSSPQRRAIGQSISKLLHEARLALRQFQYEEAIADGEAALAMPGLAENEEASVRCILAEALEKLSRFSDAVAVLSEYENAVKRERLTLTLQCQVARQLGAAYGGTKEIPKALSWARQALIQAGQYGDPGEMGACRLLLGTLYRRLGEIRFAQEHYLEARTLALRSGDDVLQAQALNGLGMVCLTESDWAGAQRAFAQAHELLPDNVAPLLRGSLYINQAIGPQLQGHWRESVELLEKSLAPLEEARQPRLLSNARSNLGYSLMRLGETAAAQEAFEQALMEARSCEALLVEASTLESLGELQYLQGDFSAGEQYLENSDEILRTLRVGFNEAQFHLTQGRCRLMADRADEALTSFQASLEICERMGDPRGQAAARLWLIETHLALGQQKEAEQLQAAARSEIERMALTPLLAQLKEVSGHLALISHNETDAIKYFSRAVTIWEMTADPYHIAVASFHLGQAYVLAGEPERALSALEKAQSLFQQLGEQPMLTRTEIALKTIPVNAVTKAAQRTLSATIVSALTRLHETGGARAVLLRELVSILHEDFAAAPVIVFHQTAGHDPVPVAYLGCDERQAKALARMVTNEERRSGKHQFHSLWADAEEQLTLYIGQQSEELTDTLLALLIRETEAGLERDRWLPRTARATGASVVLPPPLALPGLVYRSEAIRKIVEQIYNLSTSDIPILLTGETGTGKDVIARAIHTLSSRSAHPFIPFNCAATPRELVESQLFGHRHGAFTGARTDFPGLIGAAEKGTLFLDEIGELAREVQPKLLRFLQDGEIQRLGETKPRRANVRVIAATNRDLKAMVDAGEFRMDLYYRLNVVQFSLPPLRERREEIPLLAEHFLRRYTKLANKQKITLAASVINALRRYDWPGNARELENEIQRLVALTPSGTKITPEALSPNILQPPALQLVQLPARALTRRTLAEMLADTEREIVNESLARHQGNLSRVAAELGISRNGLRKMITRLRLNRYGG
ncbi:MAG TPA: sigma 54-interacting transcriptional regulator [Blastocatellia bacterium]|nr:sigma 54-interacting transcriptional regulator [Blastocatellia bacterium]